MNLTREPISVLCISDDGKDLTLVSRVIRDLGHEYFECAAIRLSELLSLRTYGIILTTHNVAINTLKELKSAVNLQKTKFGLIEGGPVYGEICHYLKQAFHFEFFVERPIKSSLFRIQIQAALEAPDADLEELENNELKLTDGLKTNYVRVLDARVAALADAISSYQSEKHQSLKAEAQRLAHNMCGTASSCGLGLIATTAFDLEGALSGVEAPESKLIESLLERLSEELKVVKRHYICADESSRSQFAMMNVLSLLGEPLDAANLDLFNQSSINLTVTHTASEFMSSANRLALDAVVIDLNCQLDSMTGFELATTLRDCERFAEVPIGFIQDSGSEATKVNCAHAGGALLLQRPFEERNLVAATSQLIGLNPNGRPRILVVDDDEDFTAILVATLGAEGMIVKSTTNPLQAEALLQEFAADLLIVDAKMPQQNGVDLCRKIRSNSRWTDLPILFLTAEKGVSTRIKAYEAGADDYLSKPLIVPELLSRVKGRLERLKLLKERMGKDALTGLLLRRSFVERIEDMLCDALRYDYHCSLCLLDVDKFKVINDTYGHVMGDEVLSELGRILARRFRAGDLRGRWGGEEFILAFPHTSSNTMKGAIHRVLEEFKLLEFFSKGLSLTGVSFSAGLASFPADGVNLKEILLCADKNLYTAKRTGRSKVCDTSEA